MKCDREEPSCAACARHNRVCIYKERQKPRLRSSYGTDLEQRIGQLEAKLSALSSRFDDYLLDHRNNAASSQQDYRPPNLLSPEESQRPGYTEAIAPTAQAFSGSSSDAPTREHVTYSRPPDTMSVRALVDSSSPHVSTPLESIRFSSANIHYESSRSFSDPEFPPHDLLVTLVDLYFKHINPWSPILDRQATFNAFFCSATPGEPERVLLHAIVATTLRFSSDPGLAADARKGFYESSRRRVYAYALEHSNIAALQALMILSLDEFGTSESLPGRNMLAVIAQNVVQLSLAVEKSVYLALPSGLPTAWLRAATLPQPKSWVEDEARRRLCWMLYVLDRYAAVATDCSFVLDDSEMDRPLPCRYDLFSKNEPVETRWFQRPERPETWHDHPDNLGSFSCHCEVLRILSQIHLFLRKPVDIGSVPDVERWRETFQSLDGKLTLWLSHLPGELGQISRLCHSDPASRVSNWIMLHAAFVTSVIRLHSCAAYPIATSHIFTPSPDAAQRCLGAVESLRGIAKDVVEGNMLDLLGHPFAFSLWVSARLLLVHTAAAAPAGCDEVDGQIRFFILTLQKMGRYWEVARHYAATLDRLVHENRDRHKPFAAMRR